LSGWRSTPDVAFDADTGTGVEVYSIDAFSGLGSWLTVGGTSLGAPAWAGIVAIVDQRRALNNESPLSSFQTLTALYSLPKTDFHVIGGGYNAQTGLGTPNGVSLIKDLVAFDTSAVKQAPPATPPLPSTPPINNWPVITQPVVTTTGSTTPIVGFPISSTSASSTPVTVIQSLTPPPAAPPVNVKKAAKRKHANKHAAGHAKVVSQAHPHVLSTEAVHQKPIGHR
jgi:hypothetical protein